MRKKLITALVWLLLCTPPACFAKGGVEAKEHYNAAWQEIKDMLEGRQPLSYERAVFLVENAWHGNALHYEGFREMMDEGEAAIRSVMGQSSYSTPNVKPDDFFGELRRKGSLDEGKINALSANHAIYSYMTDTVLVIDTLSGKLWLRVPFQYANSDPMGTADWTNTQVGNLLVNGEGNCYAFASLFRIFAERLQSGANIATAPGHVYIVHPDEQGNKHNVELASRSFPGTGTLATLTHTSVDAIKNNLALRELDLKQSVALCLVYLAKGYEHRTQTKDNGFSLACAELALAHDNMSLNAMLLKAEALEREITTTGDKSIAALRGNAAFGELEQMLGKLYSMGYLEMPLEMKNTLVMGWTKDTAAQRTYPLPPATDADNDTHTRMASLSWGLFEEDIKAKPIERYGNTLFDTKKQKITGFAAQQALYNDYNFDPVVFAWSIDPLAHKYPSISPYAAMANNPIIFTDPTGAYIVGMDGRPVFFDKVDNKIVWSANATADIIRVGNAMLKTEKGHNILNSMIKTTYPISMEIAGKDKVKFWDKSTNTYHDEYQKGFLIKLGNTHSIKDGKGSLKSAKIEIYEKNIEFLINNNQRMNLNGEDFYLGDFTLDEVIGGTGVHEGTHSADKNSNSELNKIGDVEKTPVENEGIYYKELKNLKEPNGNQE